MTPPTIKADLEILKSDPDFDPAALEWRKQKSLGTAAFRENRFPDALKHFGFAIELLPLTDTGEMAKLFTNCATTYFKISELLRDDGQKDTTVEKSLRAALKAVALDPRWWKGHFCAARCLMSLSKKEEALEHMKKVLEIHTDAEKDPAIADILKGLDFYASRASSMKGVLKDNPAVAQARFKDNVFLVDAAGKGHFRSISEALDKNSNKVSFIVTPGIYNFDEGIKIQGSSDVDIVGSPGADPADVVVFENNSTTNVNSVFVAKATLTVTNVVFRITSPKAGGNIIRVRQAGKVALNQCQASTWSQNRPCILVMNGSLIAENLTISNALNTGVAIMTGGYVKMRCSAVNNAKVFGVWLSGEDSFVECEDCSFVNCGQGLSVTSGSKGFKVTKCRISNAGVSKLKSSKVSGIAMEAGAGVVSHSEFLSPGLFAVVARNEARLELDHCSIENCETVGVGLTGGAEATIGHNKIKRCEAAISIQKNAGAKVQLDHNVIQECLDKVRIASAADTPVVEGPQHKCVVKEVEFEDPAARPAVKKGAGADVRPKSDGGAALPKDKQKVVQEVKNIINQSMAKPVDEFVNTAAPKERRCANCSKVEDEKENKFKYCSSCRMACYCTPQCQKMGWKAHKKVCHKLADARKKVEEISSQMDRKRKELAVISDLSVKVTEAEEQAKEKLNIQNGAENGAEAS